jgi:acyl-CoA dehydrogenase
MMNNARLAVGMQGVAVAESAYQKAFAYAHERRQGKARDYHGDGMAPIVHHPDVQRNLLTMKALTGVARAIAYSCAHAIDMARAADGETAGHWRDRADLLTPVAKAFSTDIGVEVASMGVQVHGGMGYIEETGAACLYRDARIAPIYEGTNGIQAIDLVMRKLPLGDGRHVFGYIGELAAIADAVRGSNLEGFGRTADRLESALDDLAKATRFLQAETTQGNSHTSLSGAAPYLRLFALAAGGVLLARGALVERSAGRIALSRFFAENHAGETRALRERVTDGAASIEAAAASLVIA